MDDIDRDLSVATSTPRFSPRSRAKRLATLTGVSVAALGISLGAAGIAYASSSGSAMAAATATRTAADDGSTGGFGGFGVVGTVKSVGADSFTVATPDNTTVTVDVTGATTYRDAAVTSPTLANVTVGERVAVAGTRSSDKVTATQVRIGSPGFGAPGGFGGFGGPGGWGSTA